MNYNEEETMKTELDENLERFFQKYKLEEINSENIKSFFQDIYKTNDYGNLLHAAVQQQYDENKVLQFIDVLLKNDVDVNYKGELTGYSFIHLALYGYTKDGEDYSYTTDFIIKLIKLAKKYNFDVQITDNDQDSIIHTALASEVYEGSTTELLKVLGDDYDVLCKDSNENNIYEALLEYKKEASKNGNDKWYQRLSLEEQAIKKAVEINRYTLEEVNQCLKNLKNDIELMLSTISIDYLLSNYSEILEKKNELEFYITKQHLFTSDLTEYDHLLLKFNQNLQQLITKYIKDVSQQPSYTSIKALQNILEKIHYSEEIELLKQVKEKYDEYIETLSSSILDCHNLNQLEKIKQQLESILDSDIREQLLMSYHERYQQFDNVIQSIMKLENVIKITDNWMKQEVNETQKINYGVLGIEQLKEIELNLENELKQNKIKISKSIEQQIDTLVQNAFLLQDENIFSEIDLWDIIHSSFDKYELNHKQKVKEKKKNV